MFDFVCWRGLLTTILSTPYERSKDWMFSIILYKGTYYLCEIQTDLNEQERINRDETNKNFTYWGFKFESYITSDSPHSTHDQVVKESADDVPGKYIFIFTLGSDLFLITAFKDPENNYATVVNSKLGNLIKFQYTLIYAAKIVQT